jgi:signal transduction histidine kinase/CheY-like chemotaxis protein/putative methionine-R-sulfoxide reductase with GAF domain
MGAEGMPDRFESFVHLLQQLREPLLIATKAGRILSANVAAAEALGTSVESLVGSELKSLVPERVLTNEWLELGNGFPVHGKDGRRLSCDARTLSSEHLLLRLSGGVDPEPRVRKLFERVSAEPQGSAGPQNRTLRSLLLEAMTGAGAFVGSLYGLDEATQVLELRTSVGFATENIKRFGRLPLNLGLPLCEAGRRRAAVYIGNGDELLAQFPELVRRYPNVVHSALACIPILADGRTIAVMGLTFPAPWSFSAAERSYLETFAEQCAPAVATLLRGAADPHASVVATRLELLQGFTGSLAATLTPGETAEVVVDIGVAATSASAGALWLMTDDGAALSLVRSVGPRVPRPEDFPRVPLDGTVRMPVVDAVRSGKPLLVESCAVIAREYPQLYRGPNDTASLACVPLFAQGRCVGGLTLAFDGERTYPPEEQAFLKLLAWHSAQAIERTRLYAAEQRARQTSEISQRRSEFMADVSMLLGSSLDPQTTLSALARAAVPRMADWCTVELADSSVSPVSAHVDPTKVELVKKLSLRLRGSTGGDRGIPAVIRTGKTELYRTVDLERMRAYMSRVPELPALYAEVGLVSSMIVPIRAGERPIGAMLLVSAHEERLYDEQDVALAEDLGRRVGLALENARLYQEARTADRLKDEFLAMLGHELRNPLAPIVSALGTIEVRGGDAFDPERKMIARHVKHLVRLVDDLLDVARITQGKIALQKARFDLISVMKEAVEAAEPLMKERRHHLVVGRAAAPLDVFGDRARLTQVLTNLLTNAARYTDPGGTIWVSAREEAGQAEVRVKDSGVGIAADALPRIFDLFVQASGSIDRPRGGLGIGLTVVKRIVELHGGTVSARSDGPGQGSEFVVRLPLAPPGEDEVDDEAGLSGVEALPAALAGLRVLVVDDNFEAATAMGDALEAIGCSARVVFDGPAALKAVGEFRPDLSLLDIGLPVMDGYTLARQLRAQGVSSRLVALTGYGQDSDRAQSHAAGFDEHVVKPVDLEALKGLLARVQR